MDSSRTTTCENVAFAENFSPAGQGRPGTLSKFGADPAANATSWALPSKPEGWSEDQDVLPGDVMQGKEIFPVYTKDSEGLATKAGNISADPELRVMAAKTLLGKCVPDLKAVEVKAQIEEKKVLDISKLNNDDLNAIERVLEHAVIDASPSREDEEIPQGVHKELLAND